MLHVLDNVYATLPILSPSGCEIYIYSRCGAVKSNGIAPGTFSSPIDIIVSTAPIEPIITAESEELISLR